METQKPIDALVIDAGPIILNEPAVSSLIASTNEIFTLPSVINEIRDEAARSRLDITLKPFLNLRDPKPESLRFVQGFARRTGDLSVLSNTDQRLIALAYELELERNGGDWRLRNTPGQKTLNGPVPSKVTSSSSESAPHESNTQETENTPSSDITTNETPTDTTPEETLASAAPTHPPSPPTSQLDELSQDLTTLTVQSTPDDPASDSDSDSDSWITPANLAAHQAADAGTITTTTAPSLQPKVLRVATLTTDVALQNVLLRINLNLVGTSFTRIHSLKRTIKRCHACFQPVHDTSRVFCPRCGKDTLTRVTCTTDAHGTVHMHLKKNMQWNNRGNRYSVPKPAGGSASGKVREGDGAGGAGGWGRSLVLAEDQKEYVRAVAVERREKARERDLMDRDALPGILSGERSAGPGRVKVGAGRNVNARKRRR